MSSPDLKNLIDDTEFGRITVEYHRAYGLTQKIKARAKRQYRTPSPEECGRVVGEAIQQMLDSHTTGRLDIEITFDTQSLKFTTIESFTE